MEQDSHGRQRWRFNIEQQQMAATICGPACNEINRTIVLKGRQIGASSFFCFLDVVMALLNPGIAVGLVVDTETKAKYLLGRCRDFAIQLGLNLTVDNTKLICLANGSQIQAITASGGKGTDESKVARAQSFQLLHLTELPFWPNQSAYDSILATSSGAPVWIETTAKQAGDKFWRLWSQPNEYRKLFFSVEAHGYYSRDPAALTDQDWAEAQKLGFTSRGSAAWWFAELRSKGGEQDLIQHLHDYPVIPEHCFMVHKGRWCRINPEVSEHTTQGGIKIYEKPIPSHNYMVGVDTSGGVGKDGNCAVVLDRHTRKLVGFWKDNRATTAEVAAKLAEMDQIWHPDKFLIETNGIGQATFQAAKDLGLAAKSITTTEATKYQGLLLARNHVEAGVIYGPEELAEEAASLYCDDDGKFKGKKDAMMAIGFALKAIEAHPLEIPIRIPADRYDPEARLKRKRGQMW